jgi:hypothetical protein
MDACTLMGLSLLAGTVVTEPIGYTLVLFGMQDRTLGPHLAAIDRILISVMYPEQAGAGVGNLSFSFPMAQYKGHFREDGFNAITVRAPIGASQYNAALKQCSRLCLMPKRQCVAAESQGHAPFPHSMARQVASPVVCLSVCR